MNNFIFEHTLIIQLSAIRDVKEKQKVLLRTCMNGQGTLPALGFGEVFNTEVVFMLKS